MRMAYMYPASNGLNSSLSAESLQMSAGAASKMNANITVSRMGAPCDPPQLSQQCEARCPPHFGQSSISDGVVIAANVPKIVKAISNDKKRKGLSHGKI